MASVFTSRRRGTPIANPTALVGRSVPQGGHQASRKRWVVNVLLAAIVFAISLWINLVHIEGTELHPDETRWLNRAYYIRDIDTPYGETWQDYYLARGQPPGGSYLMGIGLLLQGQPVDSNGVWDFHFGTEWNRMAGAIPGDDVLMAGRRTNAVVGALVVVTAFVAASLMTNRVGGLLAGLFLAVHPLHITLSTQALSDQLLALSLGVIFVAAFMFARRPTFGWALLMGVALGIGAGTKLAPLALSLVLAGFGTLWLAWQCRRRGRVALRWPASRRGILLLLQPVISGFVFVAMYPYLWVDPVGRSLALLEFRQTEMASQARIWPWAKVSNPKDAFMRYGEQLNDVASTTKHVQVWLDRHLGVPIPNPASFDFIVVAIGGLLLVRIVILRGLWSPHALVALLMAAEVAAVTVGLGVDFYRYYLPILLVNSILVGIAIGEAARVVGRTVFLRRAASTRPAPSPARASWAPPSVGRESAS